jgi:UDP-N-acetylmuramoyl-L-alanyl-D-glutamate--2,6-diaminopimelate ligase
LAAISCGLALEIKLEAICNGIADLEKIPGRFERIVAGQGFEVLVDYAHTPVALETVLEAARELTQGRLICAFGCGGDRDRGKRPLMGKVAADLADLVYVTSDNPRTESPGEIIDEIVAGMPGDGAVRIFPDRREAIHKALGTAMPGDVVVIAGKGHEMGQDLGARVVDFDDRQVAREGLREIMLRGGTREHGG